MVRSRINKSLSLFSWVLATRGRGVLPLSVNRNSKNFASQTTTDLTSPLIQLQRIDRRKSPALWRFLYQAEEVDNDIRASRETRPLRKPEVMSPAGGWSQLQAAVANGADAVYLGLQAFSARARAENFDVYKDLPRAVQYCHDYQVHVYVALNTLVFDDEMEELSRLIQLCRRAKVDAVIVQDLGLCRLIQEMEPDLHIHSSTQQSITSADGVDFCRQQHGATRVVLGRELSVNEIALVSQRTNVEIETFVHGALCVSYSGQCFSSEAWGGRSANRGQCAQTCRMPYGLVVNGVLREKMADMKYVLSPQDLCGLDQVSDLIRAGVACLKIEGRLKGATYVAATTRAYRNAVDKAWAEITGENYGSSNKALSLQDNVSRLELTQLFSRGQDEVYSGLTPGFLDGTKHQQLVRGRSPRHRGVHMGRVAAGSSPDFGLVIEPDANSLDSDYPLKLGDGIVVDRGLPQEEELGGPIFNIKPLDRGNVQFLVQFGRDLTQKWKKDEENSKKTSSFSLAPVGAHVWKTHDAVIDKKFRRLSEAPPPRRWVRVSVTGSVGEPLKIILSTTADEKLTVVGETEAALQRAETSSISNDVIAKSIGTLGNTEFAIQGDIDFSGFAVNDSLWCPVSQVKRARRDAVEQLQKELSSRDEGRSIDHECDGMEGSLIEGQPQRYLKQWIRDGLKRDGNDPNTNDLQDTRNVGRFSVLCRNYEQVDAICSLIEEESENLDDENFSVFEIMLDFLEVDGMKDAAKRIRSLPGRIQLVVASPRIIKPEEGGIWKALLALEPDALLVRSSGLLHRMKLLGGEGGLVNVGQSPADGTAGNGNEHWVRIPKLIGDFSLNAANALTAYELLSYGLDRITASYDLNANAIRNLGSLLGPSLVKRLEVVVHFKMPIFHTEHCVFARFLTRGQSFVNCGHACTRVDSLHIRDESGMDNLVLADMGCRNTVFAARSQSGLHSLKQWKQVGIRHFRIEFVDEQAKDARQIVQMYSRVWKGELTASTAWDSMMDSGGVTLGSFRNNKERRAGELGTR